MYDVMKKANKKVFATSMAAVLAASAIVPVASAEAAESINVDQFVVLKDGKNITLDKAIFEDALVEGIVSTDEVKYVKGTDSKVYDMALFNDFLVEADGNIDEAFKLLSKTSNSVDVPTVEGAIVDGELVANDETPEEKVNETFFYNLAA